MPQVAKKSATPAPKRAAKADRPVVWEHIEFGQCWAGGKDGPITAASAKAILGWESEAEYVARVSAGMTEKDRAKLNVSWPDVGDTVVGVDGRKTRVLLLDENGQKIVCWNNPRNRPFTEGHARALCQDILKRVWAGPTNFPGETINGQAGVIVSRQGEVINGNHSLVGLVLAEQLWNGVRQGAFWHGLWPTEPVLETLVVYGISEDPRVIRTVDDTRPRNYGDVVYTSDIFAKLDASAKLECSRAMKSAVKLLWHRTGAGKISSYTRYQTNAELDEFVSRHKRIVDCVKIIHDLNKTRAYSFMRLASPGDLAALLYLMGASQTNVDDYATVEPPPSDKKVNWANWDRAKAFWEELAKSNRQFDADDKRVVGWKGGKLSAVPEAIAALHDEGNARSAEKYAILALAWARWVAKEDVEPADLKLRWNDAGKLLNPADFAGIDDPSKGFDREADPEDTAAPAPAAKPAAPKGAALVRAPGEIAKAAPVQHDADGKPPAPKLLARPANKK